MDAETSAPEETPSHNNRPDISKTVCTRRDAGPPDVPEIQPVRMIALVAAGA
jgi:hypothetical protein